MIHITRTHHLSPEAARQRVQVMAQTLAEEMRLTYHWEGDRLLFKRWGAKGSIDLHPGIVDVHVKTSPFLPISEAGLRREIERRIDEALLESEKKPLEPEAAPKAKPEGGEASPLAGLLGQAISLTGQVVNLGAQTLTSAGMLPSFESFVEAGSHLRAARQHAGLSLQELSKALDVQVPFMEAVENGTAHLTAELITRISDLLAQNDSAQLAQRLAEVYQSGHTKPPPESLPP